MTPTVSRRFARAPAVMAAFLALALVAAVACRGVEEEEIPGRAALLTPEPSSPSSPAPSPSPSPVPAPTSVNTPNPGFPPRVIMTMEGPPQARPGETLTYRLTYQFLAAKGTEVIIAIQRPLNYVSSQLVAGSGHVTKQPGDPAGTIDLRWALVGDGGLEIVVQVPEDMLAGTIVMGASEPGSGGEDFRAASSNAATTTVVAP